ncbi:MAG TPA: aminotransferase class III-fold pyridoxal phosphate-dependent enzyme [Polyangiales bacterium]|nr:aminotransferase class III-fold pyridoxal phosphate-dependent enzyme [Polyangiales bacterium]
MSATLFDPSALLPVTIKPNAVMVRGAGSWLWDERGTRYLDFVQGWAVNCLGHCPEVVQRALAEQASTLINPSPGYHSAPALQLAHALCAQTGMDQAFFCSIGAEANEGAIKLARRWGSLQRGGAFEIITTLGSFHGRTLATMAASGKPGFNSIFPPQVPGFVHVPFDDVAAVAAAITERTVAVMVEPIQGEGGVVVPAPDYLPALRELCDARGLLLILDEIQTGMGRTGRLLAAQHSGVRPDILTLGKGIGGGLPLAALLCRREVSVFRPGDQGGTYTGHPVTTAVGYAVLRELTAPGFLEHVTRAGEHLRAGLAKLGAPYGASPRGVGLLNALVLPAAKGSDIVQAAMERELLINSPRPELLRFMPALNVSLAEIDDMLSRLADALRASL